MRDIKTIMNNLYGEKIPFPLIKREVFKEYSLDDALAEVETIGQMWDPKFLIDANNRSAYENVIRWVHNDPAMMCTDPATGNPCAGKLKSGIYLSGGTGTGKSWLLEVMSVYANTLGVRISFNGFMRGLTWTNVRTSNICKTYSQSGDVSFYEDVDIIGFQDLGSENLDAMYMGTRIDVMRSILEARSDSENKITLITSNLKLGGERLRERYGPRVESRLCSMCNFIELTGPDRRKIR